MKNILNYYYKIFIDEINDNGCFSFDNQLFCLYEYKRNINEIDALEHLNSLMISNNYPINKIVKNVFNKMITVYNNKNYVLIMINYNYLELANTKFIPVFFNIKLDILKRNNWGKLWSMKIDYIEYQLSHLSNNYPLINASVNYYIGLAENAISYFNMIDLSRAGLYISHRRINSENIYNPLELVIDYKARDVSEYIKNNFFNKKMSIENVIEYLKKLDLDNIDYILLYIRMLYPSYYFDIYEEIINDNVSENEINKITSLSSLYEELLYEIYGLIKRRVNIIGINWINKKYM